MKLNDALRTYLKQDEIYPKDKGIITPSLIKVQIQKQIITSMVKVIFTSRLTSTSTSP